MGKFGPSDENTKYSYNLVAYYGIFGTQSNQIKETNFNRLRREIDILINSKENNLAVIYAGKLALEYGVAGLLEYIAISTELMNKDTSKEEMIDREVMQLLGLLFFCKKMLLEQKEPKALKSMELIYSEDNFQTSLYWEQRENELLAFIKDNQSYVKKEANDIAQSLVDECLINRPGFKTL